MHRLPLAALLASLPLAASAQTPLYAVYGIKKPGSQGVVTTLNVGLLPRGELAECRRQIEVFEAAVRRTQTAAGPELLPSQCVAVPPQRLQPMVQGLALPDAYVIKQAGNWAPVYTAWYGLSADDPAAMCGRLVEGLQAKFKPGQVEVTCLPPKQP